MKNPHRLGLISQWFAQEKELPTKSFEVDFFWGIYNVRSTTSTPMSTLTVSEGRRWKGQMCWEVDVYMDDVTTHST